MKKLNNIRKLLISIGFNDDVINCKYRLIDDSVYHEFHFYVNQKSVSYYKKINDTIVISEKFFIDSNKLYDFIIREFNYIIRQNKIKKLFS